MGPLKQGPFHIGFLSDLVMMRLFTSGVTAPLLNSPLVLIVL